MNKKKYDVFISLGKDCACSMYLKRHHLRQASLPLDWLTEPANPNSLRKRFELILHDFNDFMNKDDFKYLPKDPNKINDDKHDYYENTKTGLYFYHDFKAGIDFNDQFSQVHKKYQRRINRFYRTIKQHKKVLLIWFCHDPINITDSELIHYGKKINEKFQKEIDIFIFQNNTTYPPLDKFDAIALNTNITKCIMNTYPVSVECPTQGNVTLCNKVFTQFTIRNRLIRKYKSKLYRLCARNID